MERDDILYPGRERRCGGAIGGGAKEGHVGGESYQSIRSDSSGCKKPFFDPYAIHWSVIQREITIGFLLQAHRAVQGIHEEFVIVREVSRVSR